MCGIAGFFRVKQHDAESALRRMCDQITHRGPDDEGYFHNGIAGLGMRRLSIIDLAGGHQPMHSEDQQQHIVFNGEIYNYRELKKELLNSGSRFNTHSDTEVIIRLFEKIGPDMLQQFNGMFGIAIYDEAKKQLFLARDRLGIKPLYYFWDGVRFAFASEIKALLALDSLPRELNYQSVSDYLTHRYVPGSASIWKHIHKVPPGHYLTLNENDNEPQLTRYWQCNYKNTRSTLDRDECQQEFESVFSSAVNARLIADVPVGILLSGGLDSAAVTAAVKETHTGTLNTFSVAFDEGGQYSELPYARQVAEHLNTEHHEVVIGQQEFTDYLPHFVRASDEPLADLASVPLHYVSDLAAQSVKVVLSGEGADEILGGYHLDNVMQRMDMLKHLHRLPQWLRRQLPCFAAGLLGKSDWQERITSLNLPLSKRNALLGHTMTDFFSETEKHALMPQLTDTLPAKRHLSEIYEQSETADPLHQLLYEYRQSWLVEDLLMKADKMTMASSIELRVPFLDHRLVEWAASVPSNNKVRKLNGQYITKLPLRDYASTRIPKTILDRPKQGFPVPVYDWLSGSLSSLPRELLQASDSVIASLVDKTALERLISTGTSAPTKGDNTNQHKLWMLMLLEYWMREWQPSL